MNVEGIFALLLVATLLLRAHQNATWGESPSWPWRLALIALVTLAFAPYLAFPLLADDYVHTLYARTATPAILAGHFYIPEPDRFFRPLGYLSYALDATWAGATSALWRASNLLFHLANCLLLFALCRKLQLAAIASFAAALLFGIHGSRPEVVTWVAARFDLLAVLFGLLTLLAVLHNQRLAACIFTVLATLSKESAFILPLLAIAVLVYARRPWRTTAACLLTLSAAVFAYRWHVLGGIGGYHESGTPTVFHFRLASTLKALFLRFWATLLFPINWTGGLSLALTLTGILAVAALIYLATKPANRRPLLLGFTIATLCSLPVHQFLSIGPDLEKSRVLYFASIGLAILFASLVNSRPTALAAAAVLLFQFTALQHNLAIWKRVGYLAQATCEAASHAHTVLGLPNVVDGVYFLHTGYPECTTLAPTGTLVWDDRTRQLHAQ